MNARVKDGLKTCCSVVYEKSQKKTVETPPLCQEDMSLARPKTTLVVPVNRMITECKSLRQL
jgi:hypothetical protein